jgi:hypothetical protein
MMSKRRYTPAAVLLGALLCSTPACNLLVGAGVATPAPTSDFAEREAALLDKVQYRSANGPAVFAHQVDGPLDIDASLDDWRATGFEVAHAVYQPENLSGPADLSATGLAAWDDATLYVALQVTDDALVQTQTGVDIYQGDSAEIQFDHDLGCRPAAPPPARPKLTSGCPGAKSSRAQ